MNHCFSEWISTNNVFSDSECQYVGSGSRTSVETCQVFFQNPFNLWLSSLQKSCEDKSDCTAVNWKYEGNHECILRACSLPVVPPKNPHHKWKAYYQTTPTTTTTTTTFSSTTTAPSFNGSYSKSSKIIRNWILSPTVVKCNIVSQNGSAQTMHFLIRNAKTLEEAQEPQWKLAKYSFNILSICDFPFSRNHARTKATVQLSTGSTKATTTAS